MTNTATTILTNTIALDLDFHPTAVMINRVGTTDYFRLIDYFGNVVDVIGLAEAEALLADEDAQHARQAMVQTCR